MTERKDLELLGQDSVPLMPSGRVREIPRYTGERVSEPTVTWRDAPKNLARRVGMLLGYGLYALFALGVVLVIGVVAAIAISAIF